LLPSSVSFAADQPNHSASARTKLEQLLACREGEKNEALSEKRRIEAHLRDVEAFRSELTDAQQHRLAVAKAEQALGKDRDALAKAEERLRLADVQVRVMLNAMKYLPPRVTDSAPNPLESNKRRIADWLAQFHRDNGAAIDQRLENENGFIEDPDLAARLGALLDRLQAVSSQERVPATLRIVDRPTGRDAFATGSTIYFDKAYLDRLERHYTDPKALDDQLMVAMGHELAHIQLDHVNLGFVQEKWQRFQNGMWLRDAEGSHEAYAERNNDHSDAAFRTQITEYQRDQEYQADLLGTQQALAAGVSPRSIKESFTRMRFDDLKRRMELSRNGVEPHYAKMIEDHARPAERLKALEEALGEKFWERTDRSSSAPCRRK
jgi:predicted Zn-dependent protease